MTWGAYGARKLPPDGIPWHEVSEHAIRQNPVPAGQSPVSATSDKRPQ
jgi:hypothetical protein